MATEQGFRWLAVAALSAAASSLLTYAVFRWRAERRKPGAELGAGAAASRAAAAWVTNPVSIADYEEPLQDGDDIEARDPCDPSPRTGYLSWDDYFMAVAFLSAQRSKDPNKQVGACIVDRTNVICGIGYNGFPRGCPDDRLPWAKRSADGDPLSTKYPYVCHAEMNAILNKNGASVAGARVYVTMFPCNECAKLLIQAGITEIVYHEDKAQPRAGTPAPGGFKLHQQYAASKLLLSLAGVTLRQHLFRSPVTLRLTNRAPRGVSQKPPAGLEPRARIVSDGGDDSDEEQRLPGGGAPRGDVVEPGRMQEMDGERSGAAAGGTQGLKGGARALPALEAALTGAGGGGHSGGAGQEPAALLDAARKVLEFEDVK